MSGECPRLSDDWRFDWGFVGLRLVKIVEITMNVLLLSDCHDRKQIRILWDFSIV